MGRQVQQQELQSRLAGLERRLRELTARIEAEAERRRDPKFQADLQLESHSVRGTISRVGAPGCDVLHPIPVQVEFSDQLIVVSHHQLHTLSSTLR